MKRLITLVLVIFTSNVQAKDVDPGIALSGSKLLAFKTSIQNHYEVRLREVLSKIVDGNRMDLRINVELNHGSSIETISDFDPSKSVVVSEPTSNSDRVHYENKKMTQRIQVPPGSIKKISAAILVSRNYLASLAESQRSQVLGQIEDVVEKTLGLDKSRGDSLAIHQTEKFPLVTANIQKSPSTQSFTPYYLYIAFALILLLGFGLLFIALRFYAQRFAKNSEGLDQGTQQNDLSQMNLQDKIRYISQKNPERTVQALRRYLRS